MKKALGMGGVFFLAGAITATAFTAENAPLEQRFKDPPSSARILRIVHGRLDSDEKTQDALLTELQKHAFGGMVSDIAFENYMEDETKWPPYLRGVKKAHELGFTQWLYDEKGYPSGSAGKLTLKGHPEWAARGLLIASTNVNGGATATLTLPPGKLVAAVACPVDNGQILLEKAQDVRSSIDKATLAWRAPEGGAWQVFAFTDDLIYEGTHAAVSLCDKSPCINMLMAEPTAKFIEVTHERYEKEFGGELAKYFVSTFTDEPSLQSLWMRPMPYLVLPWSETLASQFEKKYGHALLPLLPSLVSEAGAQSAKARYEFWDLIGDLVSETYFGQIQAWCEKHGIASGGHLLCEEGILPHVPLYGDFFRCIRRLDAPSIDCLTSIPHEVQWPIALYIGSIADLEKRELTMCEVSDHSQRYRPKGDTRPRVVVSEEQIRGTCNRLLFGGINTLTSYYSFDKLTDEQFVRLNTEIGRCSTMLKGGHRMCDIALFYPIESVWTHNVPSHRWQTHDPAACKIAHSFDKTARTLYAENHSFSYVDSPALGKATAEGAFLRHDDLRWRVLILPQVDTLPLVVCKKLESFWKAGGTIIAIGKRPLNSETDFPSSAVQSISKELFGDEESLSVLRNEKGGRGIYIPDCQEIFFTRILDKLVTRDVDAGEGSPIRSICRLIDGRNVYFVMNDSDAPWQGNLRFSGHGVTEQWDPVSGARTVPQDPRNVKTFLPPYGAILFRTAGMERPEPPIANDKLDLTFHFKPLPTGAPTPEAGQFVKRSITGDAANGWVVSGTLTKSDTDTFLFARFPCTAADLAHADGIAIDFTVAPAALSGPNLVFFARTKTGNYICPAGLQLAPGKFRVYARLSDFTPYSSKQPQKTSLLAADIQAVSFGWGGFFGKEGDNYTFTVQPPRTFTFNCF